MSSIILISSEKKDIGKTIIGIKLGIELSTRKKNVLLMDLSSGKRKISEYFKVDENIIYDIKDALDGTCSIEQAVLEINDNLSLLPYPRVNNKLDVIRTEKFARLVEKTAESYDYILIDIDNFILANYISCTKIDAMMMVNNNDYSSVKEINNYNDIAERLNIKNKILIINRYNKKNAAKGNMLKLNDLKKMIEIQISGIVEEDSKYDSIDYQLILKKEASSMDKIIDNVANNIINI